MHTLDTLVLPVSSSGYLPLGTRTLYLMSYMIYSDTRKAMKGFQALTDNSWATVRQRQKDMAERKPIRKDMLGQLMEIAAGEKKEDFTIADVTTDIWTVIWAGSDTTTFALSSIFYHLLKHPHTMQKVVKEIDDGIAEGSLTLPLRYLDAIKLPYLNAVIKEGMRVHPSLGNMLPRYVPAGGCTMSGKFIPAGVRVGINPNVVQFDKGVFGADADEYNPERWTRGTEEQGQRMERCMFQFGAGPRVCIGKQITMTEMYKLIPTILHNFKFELADPSKEWTINHGWFHKQKDVYVLVHRR